MFGKTKTDGMPTERYSAPPATAGAGESIISASISIKGEVTFDDALRIDGRFEGQLKGGGQLHTGPESRILGDIAVGQAFIEGSVEGNVTAAERIELSPTAKVTGDLRAPRVAIGEGAILQGTCIIGPQLDAGEKTKGAAATEAA
jgi:cytoskeletal protein CcmA (bactofilin family)